MTDRASSPDKNPNLKKIDGGSEGSTSGFRANYELVMGSIYGARAWTIASNGTLYALHAGAFKWNPGVNEAHCFKTQMDYGYQDPKHKKLTHGLDQCSCGFYAYFDPSGPEMSRIKPGSSESFRHAGGVIRATGKTVVGTKGFRTEKAEIVALYHPGFGPEPHYSLLRRFLFWVSSGSIPGLVVGALILFALFFLPALAIALISEVAGSGAFKGTLTVLSFIVSGLIPFGLMRLVPLFTGDDRSTWEHSREIADKIESKYPNVPKFGDAAAMFKQYELSPGGRYESV